MKLIRWVLMGGLLAYIWYSMEGTGSWATTCLAVRNVKAHQWPVHQSPYCCIMNGLLLCGFNMPITG